jgi:hypothetical protein
MNKTYSLSVYVYKFILKTYQHIFQQAIYSRDYWLYMQTTYEATRDQSVAAPTLYQFLVSYISLI